MGESISIRMCFPIIQSFSKLKLIQIQAGSNSDSSLFYVFNNPLITFQYWIQVSFNPFPRYFPVPLYLVDLQFQSSSVSQMK